MPLSRRHLLASAIAPALACTTVIRDAHGVEQPRITAPEIDSLSILSVVDTNHDIFISGAQVPGVKIDRIRGFRGARQARALQGEHGLSLHLTSTKGTETKRILLDFAWTADVLNNNLDLLGVDPAKLDALVLSHGHLDHFGGMNGFLEKHRAAMKDDMRLYLAARMSSATVSPPSPAETSTVTASSTAATWQPPASAPSCPRCPSSSRATPSPPEPSPARASSACSPTASSSSASTTAPAAT